MTEEDALIKINKIFMKVFKKENVYTLDELRKKFAFDIKLPKEVVDTFTNQATWSILDEKNIFINAKKVMEKDKNTGWMLPRQRINTIADVLKIWKEVNLISSERSCDSSHVAKSDAIYRCMDIYNSNNCSDSNGLIFCDSCGNSEFLLASKRSYQCNFGIRIDDSKNCSGSFNVVYSNRVVDSLFIQDCFDLYECMFCAHIASRKFCICNMQFEQDAYFLFKNKLIDWALDDSLNSRAPKVC